MQMIISILESTIVIILAALDLVGSHLKVRRRLLAMTLLRLA
jgi:hypothetical protein